MEIGDKVYYIKNKQILEGEIQSIKEEQIIPAVYEFVGDGSPIPAENIGTYEELKTKLELDLKAEKAIKEAEVLEVQKEIDALTKEEAIGSLAR